MPQVPISEEKVCRLRELAAQRIPYRKAAQIVGVHPKTAWNYVKGITPFEKCVRKLQPDEIELMQAYLICGYTTTETAALIGISTHSMTRYAPGFSRLRKCRRKCNQNPTDVAVWRRRVRAGESLFSIAVEFNVSRQIVGRYTVDIPRTAKPPTTYDHGRITELAAQGLKDDVIAERIGCNRGLVWWVRNGGWVKVTESRHAAVG